MSLIPLLSTASTRPQTMMRMDPCMIFMKWQPPSLEGLYNASLIILEGCLLPLLLFFTQYYTRRPYTTVPSSNTIEVTRTQALVLIAISTRSRFNFGKMVFQTVLQFVEGWLKSTKLPFPSLIYGILESQRFIRMFLNIYLWSLMTWRLNLLYSSETER